MKKSDKTKVAIVYSGARYFGGIETYLKQLFTLTNDKKVDLVLLSMGSWPLTDSLHKFGKNVVTLSGSRIRPMTISEIANYVENNNINLIVSQGIVANFYARLASRKSGVPNIVTVHSDMKYEYPNPIRRFVFSLSDQLLRRNTNHYIAVSRYLKNCLIEKGIKQKKISVIYNCIEQRDKIPKRKYNKKITKVGSIGRLHRVKGFDNLISAISLLKNEPITLTIWGEGEQRKELQNLIEKFGLQGKVFLPGFTPDIEKAILDMDIYVQSSLNEGFGLSTVEALSLGTPVIVTPAGSLSELIEKNKTGIIAKGTSSENLARAIKKLIEDPKFAEEMGKRATQDVKERFSPKRWIEETEEVYLRVAK